MATNKPISGFPTLLAATVQPADQLVIVDVSDTSSATTGTTKNITLAAALNNPQNGIIAGQLVPQLGTAFSGGIVKTAPNGMVFRSAGGSLTDYAFLDATGNELLALRSSDEAVIGGKLTGLSVVPTVAVAAGAGTGATVSVIGSNTAGLVTLVTGTGVNSAALMFTLTFSLQYTGAATGSITYSFPDGSVNNYPPLASATTSTTLQLATLGSSVLSDSTSYKFNYVVIGYGN